MTNTHWKAAAMLAAVTLIAFAPAAQATETVIGPNPCQSIVTSNPTVNTVVQNCRNLFRDADGQLVILVNEVLVAADGVAETVLATCFQDMTPVPLVVNCLTYAIGLIPDVPTAEEIIAQLQAVLTWLLLYSGDLSTWNAFTVGQANGYVDSVGGWAATLDEYAIAMNLYLQGEAAYYGGYGLAAFGFGLCQATGPQPCASPGVPRAPGPEPTPQDLPALPAFTPPPVRTDVPITLL